MIATSVPDASALKDPLTQGGRAGHRDHHGQLGRGRVRHACSRPTGARRPERGDRRRGRRQAVQRSPGAKSVVVVIHEASNSGLTDRAAGVKKTFKGTTKTLLIPNAKSDIPGTAGEDQGLLRGQQGHRRAARPRPRRHRAGAQRPRRAGTKVGTFDVNADVITDIKAGQDPVRDRPAAVPAGLPAGRLRRAVREQPEHGRRRQAGADRPGHRQQGERGEGRGARQEGHALGDRPAGGWHRCRPPARCTACRDDSETAATAPARRRAPRARRTSSRGCVGRPDIGAFFGAVAVFFLFAYTAQLVGWLADLGIASQWTGSVGAVRDRRRAGRAADDRRRVRPLGRRDDRQLGPAARPARRRAPTGTSGRRSPSCSLFGAAIGFINGFTVVKTKLPSFIVTLGTFFILQGVNAGGTLKITGTVVDQRASTRRPGFDSARPFFASTVWSPYDFKVNVIWWLGLTVLGRLAARAHALRQLDLRRRRRSRGRAQRRRAGRAHEDRALHDDLDDRRRCSGSSRRSACAAIQANEGVGREFIFIIAAVVGGCLLTGGYGSVIGAAFGAAILGMASIGIIVSQWDSELGLRLPGRDPRARGACSTRRSGARAAGARAR